MIEEAAGTRMYESKRTAAQKTIGKKDAKLKEIETVSVTPLVINHYYGTFYNRGKITRTQLA